MMSAMELGNANEEYAPLAGVQRERRTRFMRKGAMVFGVCALLVTVLFYSGIFTADAADFIVAGSVPGDSSDIVASAAPGVPENDSSESLFPDISDSVAPSTTRPNAPEHSSQDGHTSQAEGHTDLDDSPDSSSDSSSDSSDSSDSSSDSSDSSSSDSSSSDNSDDAEETDADDEAISGCIGHFCFDADTPQAFFAGEVWEAGEGLSSGWGCASVIHMEEEGDLQMMDCCGTQLWRSGEDHFADHNHATFQDDGNMIIQRADYSIHWSLNIQDGYSMVITEEGELKVFSREGEELWAAEFEAEPCDIQCDPGCTYCLADGTCLAWTECDTDEYVSNHECVACSTGAYNSPGDDARGDDTTCDGHLCEEDHHVSDHECKSCLAGYERTAGDDTSGSDTACVATLCGGNEYVFHHICTPCAEGTGAPSGADASGDDTECSSACIGDFCPGGGNSSSTMKPGDKLYAGDGLISMEPGCISTLVMESHGQLVLYDCCGSILWTSTEDHHATDDGSNHVNFQSDGNLVVIRSDYSIVWASNTEYTDLLTLHEDYFDITQEGVVLYSSSINEVAECDIECVPGCAQCFADLTCVTPE